MNRWIIDDEIGLSPAWAEEIHEDHAHIQKLAQNASKTTSQCQGTIWIAELTKVPFHIKKKKEVVCIWYLTFCSTRPISVQGVGEQGPPLILPSCHYCLLDPWPCLVKPKQYPYWRYFLMYYNPLITCIKLFLFFLPFFKANVSFLIWRIYVVHWVEVRSASSH